MRIESCSMRVLVVAGRIMVLMIVAWFMHFMLIRLIFRIFLRLTVIWTRLFFSFFRSWFIFWVLALGHFTHPLLKVWNYRFFNRPNQHARRQKKDIVWYCIGFAAKRLSVVGLELNCLGGESLVCSESGGFCCQKCLEADDQLRAFLLLRPQNKKPH